MWKQYCRMFNKSYYDKDEREIFEYKLKKVRDGDKKWMKNNPNFTFMVLYFN